MISIRDVVALQASEKAATQAYIFLTDGEREEDCLSYAALQNRSCAIGAELHRSALQEKRVVLLFQPGLEFITAFLGCLQAGAIAVPAYPPRSQRHLPRLLSLVEDAQPSAVLTSAALLPSLQRLCAGVEGRLASLRWIAVDLLPDDLAAGWEAPQLAPESLAFLQYTSGSTAAPKGVMVSHGNLGHNEEMIRRAFDQSEDSVVVGWLPLYHDMGLIGNVLQPLYTGARCILMSPMAFLQRPSRWLEAIARYRGTTSGGPNFAYELCVRKVGEEARAGLDLSSWQVAFSGAEPVRAATLERFAAAFAPYGFRREAFYPCYGLAEATLFVSGGLRNRSPRMEGFATAALEEDRAEPAPEGMAPRELVSCGRAWMEQQVAIVDPATGMRCAPGRVGEIWVSGPSVAQGYWSQPEATERDFRARLADGPDAGPFLRTGDLGFVYEEDLFITGRRKDLIILRGRNHYPQDLELTSELAHPALRPGCSAAFSVEVEGEERLVLVCEVEGQAGGADEVGAAIRQAVAEEHEVRVHQVLLLRAGTIPKTSSGKVRRHACRAGYLDGSLAVVGRSGAVWDEGVAAPVPALGRQELLALPPDEQPEALLAWLGAEVARLLEVPLSRVPAETPLTALGLDSLAAVELGQRLAASLGVEVSVATLLAGADLATVGRKVLEGLAAERGAPEGPRPAAGGPAAESPLSFGQTALWFLHRLAPESGAYHIAAAARVAPPLDVMALRWALGALAGRHSVLRTTFHQVEGAPYQRVNGSIEPEVLAVDAANWSAQELEERTLQEAYRPFDLATGPLLRVAVFRRSSGEDRLLLATHHIISDFSTLTILTRELSALYTSASAGTAAALPPPSLVSYADYVQWERAILAGPEGERLWEFWRRRLEGPLPVLDLPIDRPRPPVQSYAGSCVSASLGFALFWRVAECARDGGATLSSTLLAVFMALLHRYTGQEDLIVGMPHAGRRRAELVSTAGYFVNPVVLRADLSGGPGFAALLDRVRQTALAAFEHQEYPFALLAERLPADRDPSRSSLFQVMFLLLQARRPEERALVAFALREGGAQMKLGGHVLESVAWREPTSQLDLTLRAGEVGDSLVLSLQYNSDLFDAATVRRMLGHLQVLLDAAVADPGRSIGELPLLAPAERDQVLFDWSGARAGRPAGAGCLHDLFEAAAARTPEASAIIDGDRRWTYDELNRHANRLAHHLRRLVVAPEQLVGVLMGRSAETVAALLGVLKAGAAYVPLDPAYPADWLAFAAEDARLSLLLTEERFSGRLTGLREVRVDALGGALAREPDQNLEPLAIPGNLAYVMYTSGSTGRPKGVAIEHRAPVERMHWARAAFPSETLAGVLASTSICFDLSIFEMFAPLSWGGTVVLAENALALPGLPAARRVKLVNTVPSAMAELASAELPPGLRTVNLAGEPLPPQLVARIYSHAGVERILNLYGPTEDATYSTCALIERGASRVSIGRPLPSTRAYVLDRRRELVPAGVPGELCLAGAGAARGYLGRPDLTAERFIPDPFAAAPGGRLYRTGDLARWLATGELELLGRLDYQVKVRGFRIELEEIEEALRGHPLVREAVVVVVREAPGGGQSLAAWVAPADAGVQDLRSHLGARLPAYMMPSTFHLLAALPRMLNGKIDRRALPVGEAIEETAHVAPRTPAEELVAEIWAEVLARPRVSATDNFFRLGGHSLLAVRAAWRLQSLFGVPVSVQQILQSQTVSELAAQIDGAQGSRSPMPPPLERAPAQPWLPLSFSQESLWFLSRLHPESPLYNVPVAVRLTGALSVPALRLALARVVERHDALRTTFAEGPVGPFQRVAVEARPELPVADLSGLTDAARQHEALALACAEADRPFDLEAGPLLRANLLRLGPREHVFLLTLHHIVSDGWSLALLLREVEVVYGALLDGRPAPLPPLPLQLADFAVWQRGWLTGAVLEGELAWWRDYLTGAPPALDLPADRPRPARPSHRGASRSLLLTSVVARDLAALGRREGATLFMVALAAFQALLSRASGQEEILVGTPVAYRPQAELEDLIGFFVNTLVLRTNLSGDPPFRELLARVRDSALAAFDHQGVPFEKLVEELAPERSLARSPLFQIMFALQNAPAAGLDLPDLSTERLIPRARPAKFDLTLTLTQERDRLLAELGLALDLFDPTTGARLLGHFGRLLAAICEDPSRPIRDLPLLDEPEEQQLLIEWNDTAHPMAPASIHEIFELQVARSPDVLAVEAGGEILTYGQLSASSDRLAQNLCQQGVGLESRVGVFLPRSVDQIVAILGVLKAGGAYVPLDPASPRERLHLILEEAGISVVVTAEILRDLLPSRCVAVLPNTGTSTDIPALPDGPPRPATGPENLAYVLYTSGSTGRPKGVMIEHRSVVNLLTALRETVYRGAGGPWRIALNAPLVFDASVKQWIQLLDGHSLHIVPDEVRPDAGRMLQLLRDRGVQVLDCTPGQLSYLLAAGLVRQPGSLERVLVGGEELPRSDWSLLAAAGRPCFYNVYGPTECTVDAAVAGVRSDRPVLGRPIANVRVYLLDSALNPVPPGVPGELCIGGAGVARGYLRRPAQTAESFVPDPWAPAPGARIYRTGDLARQLADGVLEFLGRLDHQVKVHGFRIELGEIEALLGEHPDVQTVAVLARTDELGQYRLVAYMACRGRRTPSASDLRSHLERRLPSYMVPSGFVALAELPCTSNGKIDRSALLALGAPVAEHRGVTEPSSPLEKVLAGMVAEVLGLERVGLHDNFFELGGHSMRAAELVASLREAFGIDLPLFHVFDAPTVAGLAAVLLESPEWCQTVEELSPALLQLIEPPGPATSVGSEEK